MAETQNETQNDVPFDYSFVHATARVAFYDDMQSSPRITKIEPAATNEFIQNLTVAIYEQSKLAGGKIPYTRILEVVENFIHAQFREIVVSILDDGNTIRFTDQGPGIPNKEKAQMPGFTTATEPMKNYIHGVGSGLPIVKDYFDEHGGTIVIEDNLTSGAVVTISLVPKPAASPSREPLPLPRFQLNDREQEFVKLLNQEGEMRVSDLVDFGYAPSTVANTFKKLEEQGLVEKLPNKKRVLTDLGQKLAAS